MPVQSPLHTHCQLGRWSAMKAAAASDDEPFDRNETANNSLSNRVADENESLVADEEEEEVVCTHCPCPEHSFGHPASEQNRPW